MEKWIVDQDQALDHTYIGIANFHSGSIGFTASNIYCKHDIMYLDTIILFVVSTYDTENLLTCIE